MTRIKAAFSSLKKSLLLLSVVSSAFFIFGVQVPSAFGAALCVTNPENGLCAVSLSVTPASSSLSSGGSTNVTLQSFGILQYDVYLTDFYAYMVEDGTGVSTDLYYTSDVYGITRTVNTGPLTKSVTVYLFGENTQGMTNTVSAHITVTAPSCSWSNPADSYLQATKCMPAYNFPSPLPSCTSANVGASLVACPTGFTQYIKECVCDGTPPLASCTLPWGGTIASGGSVTAYQASSVTSPATCTSETRACTSGSLSGSYTNQTCTVTAAPVDATCATTHYACSSGTSVSNVEGAYNWTWTCNGANGGTNASCSEYIPHPTNQTSSCSASGTSATVSWTLPSPYTLSFFRITDNTKGIQLAVSIPENVSDTGPSTTFATIPGHNYTSWIHTRLPSGAYSSEVYTSFACANPTNAVCSTTHYNCASGTSVNNVEASPNWTWTCTSTNGGTNASCTELIPPPTNQTSSCSAAGTTGSFSWVLPSGYTQSFFRITDNTLGTDPATWIPENVADTGPATSMTTIPGHSYTWRVHTRLSDGGYSSWTDNTLVCPNPAYSLTVTKAGTGTGTVTGSSINCGSTCSHSYTSGTTISLTPAPDTNSTFTGWSGACSGTGTCSVTLSANASVTATFTKIGDIGVTISANPAGPFTTPGATNLSWVTIGTPDSCDATGAYWSGTNITNGSPVTQRSGMPAGTYDFGIRCYKTGVLNANSTVTVVVNPIPPPTNQTSSCSAAGTTGSFSWTLPSGYTQSFFRITDNTLGTDPATWIPENVADTGPATSMTTIPGHSYTWRVHTRLSDGGYSSWTDNTLVCPNPAAPTVTTSDVSNITQTTATSGGTISSNGGATVSGSGIVWSTTANPTLLTYTGINYYGWTIGGPWSDSISGLTAGTTYHIRAYATNSAGTSYGADVQFTTGTASCPTITIGSCDLSETVSGGSSGSCSSGYTIGACSYSCFNSTWSINSNSCALPLTCTAPIPTGGTIWNTTAPSSPLWQTYAYRATNPGTSVACTYYCDSTHIWNGSTSKCDLKPIDCSLDGTPIISGYQITASKARTATFPITCASISLVRHCTNGSLDGDPTYQYATPPCIDFVPSINSFTVIPTRVHSSGAVTIKWSTTDVTGCLVKKGSSTQIGSGKNSPAEGISDTVTSQTIYTITCDSLPAKSVIVNVVPFYEEF